MPLLELKQMWLKMSAVKRFLRKVAVKCYLEGAHAHSKAVQRCKAWRTHKHACEESACHQVICERKTLPTFGEWQSCCGNHILLVVEVAACSLLGSKLILRASRNLLLLRSCETAVSPSGKLNYRL
eukprot:5283206-Amphidinium_carterae.1